MAEITTTDVKHVKLISAITTILGSQKDSIKDAVIGKGVPVIIDRSADETNAGMFYVIGDGSSKFSELTEYAMITGDELAGYVSPDELYDALGAPETLPEGKDTWSILDTLDSIVADFNAEGDNSALTSKFEAAVEAVLDDNGLITEDNIVSTLTEKKSDVKTALSFLEAADQYLPDSDALKTEALALVDDNDDPLLVTTAALNTTLDGYISVDEDNNLTNENLVTALANLAKLDFSKLGEGKVIDLSTVLTTTDFIVGDNNGVGTDADDVTQVYIPLIA